MNTEPNAGSCDSPLMPVCNDTACNKFCLTLYGSGRNSHGFCLGGNSFVSCVCRHPCNN